jgi:hypothetical protein
MARQSNRSSLKQHDNQDLKSTLLPFLLEETGDLRRERDLEECTKKRSRQVVRFSLSFIRSAVPELQV